MAATTAGAPTSTQSAARTDIERALRSMAATTAVGVILGALVGGVAGRLAMRVLFLTSTAARGIVSDDGFIVGKVTLAGTLNLLLVCAGIGVIGAFVYRAVRPLLIGSEWLRSLTCAAGAGAVIGSMLVHTDGRDFVLLEPTWLAIALFVAVPALFGGLAAPAIEWATRPEGWFATAPRRLALAPLAVFAFPPLLVLVAVPAAAVAAGAAAVHRRPRLSAALQRPAVLWLVRAGWLAVAVVGLAYLIRDAAALL